MFSDDPLIVATRSEHAASFAALLLPWAEARGRTFPWRSTRDPWRILLAEVLLQRSRAKTVAKVYTDVLDRWPDPVALATAPLDELAATIRPLGLVARAPRLLALAKQIALLGEMPSSEPELAKLPGVGPYAAAAAAGMLGFPTSAMVDTVSDRVFRRYFGARRATSAYTLAARAYSKARKAQWHQLNWAVLDLAASVCLPSRPQCMRCPLLVACRVGRKNRTFPA